jgi:hypothetical protein
MYMFSERAIAAVERIDSLILTIRGQRVMLDSNLARIYGVATMRLNEQFKRNRQRFPSDFAFQLTPHEFAILISQLAISRSHGGRRKLPFVFTEHGAIMLASVLNSPIAVAASVAVVRAFVRLRELAMTHKELAKRLDELEKRMDGHDKSLKHVCDALRQIMSPPSRAIGFHVRYESSGKSAVPPVKALRK